MSAWITALVAGLGAGGAIGGLYLRRKRRPQYISIRMQTLEHRWACQAE